MATIHIIGAGVSGLACATRAAMAGTNVALYEAAGHAGGRARSFEDDSLGCMIDNGSHLLLGANEATRAYLSDIGAEDSLLEIAPAAFPFMDMATGERWRIRPGRGALPLWMLSSDRRIPRTSARDHLRQFFALYRASRDATVAEAVGADTPLFEALWQPLCRAALNTDAREASASLMWSVVRETFMKGEQACRPMFFHKGLSAALVNPALRMLGERSAAIRLKARLRGLRWSDHRVTSLYFPEGMLRVDPGDAVVLAVPPDACGEIWPEAQPPLEARTIVNAHFRLDEPVEMPWGMPFLGLVNAETHWIFQRDNILSLTVSAGDALAERPNWELANLFWADVGRVFGRPPGRMPPWRVIKERRATFAQTPGQVGRRPGSQTSLRNLFLAGDWTATGLPATIEGSVRSGFRAAQLALAAVEDAAANAEN
ncbi:MAG: hydroxysqualene dehydroxylase HpnE [Rhodospirillaceae bacterium]